MSLTDYRDRASVMIWVVLMGLAAQRFLVLPERAFTSEIFGSPITLTITANTILAVLLTGLVASGTEAVVRAHPNGEPPSRARARRHPYASSATPIRPLVLNAQERATLVS